MLFIWFCTQWNAWKCLRCTTLTLSTAAATLRHESGLINLFLTWIQSILYSWATNSAHILNSACGGPWPISDLATRVTRRVRGTANSTWPRFGHSHCPWIYKTLAFCSSGNINSIPNCLWSYLPTSFPAISTISMSNARESSVHSTPSKNKTAARNASQVANNKYVRQPCAYCTHC